jgi:hypothetical protein
MIHAQTTRLVRLLNVPRAAATAVASATFDVAGADYADIVITLSSELNTNAVGPVIALAEADTSNATNFATVVANSAAQTLTAAKGYRQLIDLKGRKRYLRLTITPGTATNDSISYSAVALLGRLEQGPSGTTGMVATTTDPVVIG